MKSEVLGKMVSEKEEKKEKLLEFPKYSDWAVMSLIKFVYGFYELSLENDVSHEDLLQLIEMSVVYDVRGVQCDVADVIENYLTKENVFEVLQVCKENDAEEAVNVCVQFVDEHFNKEEMVQSGRIKFPEIAAKFIEHDHHSIISVPDHVQRIVLSKLEKTSG